MPIQLRLVTIFPILRYWHPWHIQVLIPPVSQVDVEDFWPGGRVHASYWWHDRPGAGPLQVEMYVFAPAGWQIVQAIPGLALTNCEIDLHGGGLPMVRLNNLAANQMNLTILGYSWETY